MLNAPFIYLFKRFLLSTDYVPAWSKNFSNLKELKTLDSGEF